MRSLVVDAHQHFWSLRSFSYPWMTAEMRILRRDYLPEDLATILARSGVDRTVVVQAVHSVDETRWLLALANAYNFISGVVGWVDMAAPEVGEALDELGQDPYFKGVRHIWHDEHDDAWILRPDVLRGLGEVARRSLTYDLLIRPRHLQYVQRLAERHPDLRLVVDHIAKPQIADGLIEPWAAGLRAVARYPNIYCKLSGIITEARWDSWKPDDLKPYVRVAVDAFGPDRVMFGSDWPVCLLAGSYEQVLGALKESLANLSEEERRGVFGGNAIAFYRLWEK